MPSETAVQAIEERIQHRDIVVDGVRLHVVEAGTGPLVVLLHGFPEFWYSWRHQIPALADAGFRVVAIDQRGYNTSDKPPKVTDYAIARLADDVAGVIEALGETQADVVGHDWGAAIAWVFAMRHPDRLRKLAILNVPHPVRMVQGLKTFRQLRKSWYIFFFQLPWLPEWSFRRGNFASLRKILRKDPVRRDAFSEEDIRRYVDAMAQPGALTAAINYYRCSFGQRRSTSSLIAKIEKPVLVIWGEQDRYLGAELAEPPAKWVSNCQVVRIPDSSHWVQVDAAERVNTELVQFFRAEPASGN